MNIILLVQVSSSPVFSTNNTPTQFQKILFILFFCFCTHHLMNYRVNYESTLFWSIAALYWFCAINTHFRIEHSSQLVQSLVYRLLIHSYPLYLLLHSCPMGCDLLLKPSHTDHNPVVTVRSHFSSHSQHRTSLMSLTRWEKMQKYYSMPNKSTCWLW